MMSQKHWPHGGIFLLLALSFIAVVLAPRSLSFLPGIIGLIGCGVLAATHALRWRTVMKSTAVRWMAILAFGVPAVALLSMLWSIAPDTSIERAEKLSIVLVPSIFLFVYIAYVPVDALKRFAWLVPAGLAIALGVNAADIHGDGAVYRMMRDMPDEPLQHIAMFNRASVAQVFAFFPLIFLLRDMPIKKSWRGVAMAALIALLLLVLSGTDSQSSQMAFIVGALAIVFFPYKIKGAYLTATAAIIALICAAPFMVTAAYNHLGAMVGDVEWLQRGYALQRLEIWDMVARKSLENPVLGHGIEATKMTPAFDSQMIYYSQNKVLHPHNFALQIWMEFGAVGILLFSLFVAALLRAISRFNTSMQRMGLAMLVAVFAVGSTGYGIWQSWWIGLLVMTGALALLTIRLNRTKI